MKNSMKGTVALSAIVATLMLSGQAMAAISITSVSGIWTAVDPDAPDVTGAGTSSIRWGTPPLGGDQSGYDFVGAAPPAFPVTEGVGFDLGDFTHLNNPIVPPSLNTATLTVTTDLLIDGSAQSIDSVFNFVHNETPNNETPNNANPCADGGQFGSGVNVNGCADLVTFSLNIGSSESFLIGGTEFFVDILGFQTGGSLATEFWTTEQADNTAQLTGVITSEVRDIPVPATFGLLSLGLISLGTMIRRRKV